MSFILGFLPFRYCTTDSGRFQGDVDRQVDGGSLSDSFKIGEDSSRCSQWIQVLIERKSCTRACANKLGCDEEKSKVQRVAKRYDEDGHSKGIENSQRCVV